MRWSTRRTSASASRAYMDRRRGNASRDASRARRWTSSCRRSKSRTPRWTTTRLRRRPFLGARAEPRRASECMLPIVLRIGRGGGTRRPRTRARAGVHFGEKRFADGLRAALAGVRRRWTRATNGARERGRPPADSEVAEPRTGAGPTEEEPSARASRRVRPPRRAGGTASPPRRGRRRAHERRQIAAQARLHCVARARAATRLVAVLWRRARKYFTYLAHSILRTLRCAAKG